MIEPRTAAVFIHGLWMNGLELTWLRAQVRRAGFDTYQFLYPTVRRGLARNAEALFHYARGIEADELHFVGYSLGGVVTLAMLSRFGAQLPPGRAVLIGSPVAGSAAARGLTTRGWGRLMLGRARECLVDGDCAAWRGERELGVIAGTRSIGLGRLFGALEVPNDGTVALAETEIAATARLELPLTHVTLMFSRQVARATTAFLAHGRFPSR